MSDKIKLLVVLVLLVFTALGCSPRPLTQSVLSEVCSKYCVQYEGMELDSCNIVNDTVHIGCYKVEKQECEMIDNYTELCKVDIKNVILTRVYLLSIR